MMDQVRLTGEEMCHLGVEAVPKVLFQVRGRIWTGAVISCYVKDALEMA